MSITNNNSTDFSINTVNLYSSASLTSEVDALKQEIQNEIQSLFSDLLNDSNSNNFSEDGTSDANANLASDDSVLNDLSTSKSNNSSISSGDVSSDSGKSNSVSIGTVNVYLNDIIQGLNTDQSYNDKVVEGSYSSNFSSLPFNVPEKYKTIINNMANKYSVPANLIAGVINAESAYNQYAVSGSGAEGLMQLMPTTANELGVKNSFDVEQNIEGGTKYLAQMLDRYDGDSSKALAAYNAGAGNVDKYNGVPPFTETQNYVSKIMNYLT